ncbi:LAETG motif-containing sortase-dependent surface protein [Streptomyces cinnamoneus]|uniref:Gram-positive cocci surface proteins LPxTG domain-containing protein n=1 Tax=Streptomyces cinnamoneus TaxID=53446 RepID=A0A918TQP6_STRCJ|nr:LAETG motif-containing sortase-dependent surface protein [Streptomyces cinnamoneus]GHC58986.1 hypothetical protein GCM10010507_39840 [Streptomyces cinnamoneus]
MKLRRALAAAVTTAALCPAALAAPPLAHATPGPTPGPTAGPALPSAAPSGTPAPTGTPPVPSASRSMPPPSQPPTTGRPSPGPSGPPSAAPSAAPGAPATASPSPAPSAAPSRRPDSCTRADVPGRKRVTTELRGLPSEIEAGSGWQEFTFRTTNVSDHELSSVAALLDAWSWRTSDFSETTAYLTVQWYDPATSSWRDVPRQFGYFGEARNLAPRAYADARLRLQVDAEAPAGIGAAFQLGHYRTGEGTCGYGEGEYYYFDVLPSGSRPGRHEDAKGTAKPPAKLPARPAGGGDGRGGRPAPQGGLSAIPVSGRLAATGSSSTLPAITASAGAALAVGAGAVVLVRRRRGAGGGNGA